MSISSIGQSNASLYSYNWNNQQLQTPISINSSASSANAYSFEGTSTVAAMVELAKYAMDAMGVGSNERVTFSQIEKYKQELEENFTKNLNESIEMVNISDQASFTVSLDADGKTSVISSHEDKEKIQNYFDVYPEITQSLRNELDLAGFEGNVQFTVNASGVITAVNSSQGTYSKYLEQSSLGTDIIQAVKSADQETVEPFSLSFTNDKLTLEDSDHPNGAAIQEYLDANPSLIDDITAQLEEIEISSSDSNVRIYIDAEGKVRLEYTNESQNTESNDDLQEFLTENNVGNDLKNNLKSLGIDPDIDFRLTVEDGKIVVNSDHPDAAKIQILINNNEELTKDYLQVDALAGLEGARKAMQVDPTAMRKRIEMESMAVWWANTGTSSIGAFDSGNLTTFSGVNSVV